MNSLLLFLCFFGNVFHTKYHAGDILQSKDQPNLFTLVAEVHNNNPVFNYPIYTLFVTDVTQIPSEMRMIEEPYQIIDNDDRLTRIRKGKRMIAKAFIKITQAYKDGGR